MKLNNIVAAFHFLILPVVVYLVWQQRAIASVFALSLLLASVFIDIIARFTIHKHVRIHSFLHPFSDKILVLVLLFVLVGQGVFSGYVLLLFVLRDIVVGFLRMRASRDDVALEGEIFGKLITTAQFSVVFVVLVGYLLTQTRTNFTTWETVSGFVLFLLTLFALSLAIVSVVYYVWMYTVKIRQRITQGKELAKHQEKMVILVNRKSGGYQHHYRRRLLRRFAKRRKARMYNLPRGRDIFKGVDEKVQDAKQVVIAGGDGSFEGALNNPILQQKSLGFFPLGAGNCFYSYFYKGKRFEYLRSRFSFKVVPMDVMELEWENGKRQSLFMSIGIDAEVMKHSSGMKDHTFKDYFVAGAKMAFGKQLSYDLRVVIDGKEHTWYNCFNVILGKAPYLGFGLRSLVGEVKPDDGQISGMALVNTHSAFFNKLLRGWGLFLSQLSLVAAPLVATKGKEYFIASKKGAAFPLEAGGEYLGETRWIKIRVARQQDILMI